MTKKREDREKLEAALDALFGIEKKNALTLCAWDQFASMIAVDAGPGAGFALVLYQKRQKVSLMLQPSVSFSLTTNKVTPGVMGMKRQSYLPRPKAFERMFEMVRSGTWTADIESAPAGAENSVISVIIRGEIADAEQAAVNITIRRKPYLAAHMVMSYGGYLGDSVYRSWGGVTKWMPFRKSSQEPARPE